MFSAILAVLTFIAGMFMGVFHAKLLEVLKRLKALQKSLDEKPKQSHVTVPSYYPPTVSRQTGQVINPKTPQQLEREAQVKQMSEMERSRNL